MTPEALYAQFLSSVVNGLLAGGWDKASYTLGYDPEEWLVHNAQLIANEMMCAHENYFEA